MSDPIFPNDSEEHQRVFGFAPNYRTRFGRQAPGLILAILASLTLYKYRPSASLESFSWFVLLMLGVLALGLWLSDTIPHKSPPRKIVEPRDPDRTALSHPNTSALWDRDIDAGL